MAAFFDLDKTIISRSSALAFVPSFYRHGLISRSAAVRGACGQFVFRSLGAGPTQMARIAGQVSELCRGWSAEQVGEIVRAELATAIIPYVYPQARTLLAAHAAAAHDVIIVSSSGQEMVAPIAVLLGAGHVIATRMQVATGRYTGVMEFFAYGEAKAASIRDLAAERGYRLADCFAYSDSVTDVPMLEAVGHPHAVNPDRALRKLAQARGWPVLAFGDRSAAVAGGTAAVRSQQLSACDDDHRSRSGIGPGVPPGADPP